MSKVLLGDVARERRETCKGSKDGYPVVGLEHLIPEEITLSAWDEEKENTFTKLFRKGDVLFGRRRAYLKKAAVAPFDGICSGDITVIEAIPEKILPELLPFIIQNDALFDFAVGKSAGSLSPRVKWEHLKNYSFELPDMEEQHRLAKVLWAMDATKKAYQKLIQKTDELVKSQFIAQFGHYIQSGNMHPLSDVCRFVDYRGKTPPKVDEGVLLITAKNVRPGFYSSSPQEYMDASKYDSWMSRGIPKCGDILFTTEAPLGNVCRIPNIEGKFAVGQRLLVIQPDQSILNNDYVAYVLQSDYFQNEVDKHSSGSTAKGIKARLLIKIGIPVPPLNKQIAFSELYQQSDKSKFAALNISNLNLSLSLDMILIAKLTMSVIS